MTNPNPASTLAADELYEGAMKWMQEFARACAFGNDDDRIAKASRLGNYIMALHKLASTPSAAPVAVGEAVLKVEDGVIVWSKLPKGADALLYAHPPTAQVAERQPLTEWQPIDSAPKDGTPMLVFYNRMVIEAWFAPRWGKFVQSESGGTNNITPTHWMPLPAAPGDTPRVEPAQPSAEVTRLREALKTLIDATKKVSIGQYDAEAHDIAVSLARKALAAARTSDPRPESGGKS